MVVRPDDEMILAVARLVRELVEAHGMARAWSEAVRPRSTADLVALLNAGVITLAEARRYLRLRDGGEKQGGVPWS